MAVEAARPVIKAKIDSQIVYTEKEMQIDYEAVVEEARDCLLIRDFKHCHKLCLSGISRAKIYIEEDRLVNSWHGAVNI